MREATLITGLVTQRVHRVKDYAQYYVMPGMRPYMASDGEMLATEANVQERIVPITQFCRPGRADLYIAYSEEVEDMLGMPIRVLLKEKEQALEELNRLRSLTAWQHLKAAWKAWRKQ